MARRRSPSGLIAAPMPDPKTLSIWVILIAGLDPAVYTDPDTRSAIYLAKSLAEQIEVID